MTTLRSVPVPFARVLGVVLVVLLLASVGCRPGDAGATGSGGSSSAVSSEDPFGLSVTAELLGVPRSGDARVQVTVTHFGERIDDADVVVTGDMFHAGMEPVVVAAASQGDGTYLTPALEFAMAGDWFLTVDVTYPDGSSAQEGLFVMVRGR